MNAHTPTPWYADQDQREGYEWNVHIIEDDRPHMRICFMSNGEQSQANAALIVEAVNSHASLKARIEELEEALEKVRSYNVDIAAGRINYRPHDHIQVIDMALKGAE
jgi:hypothetical protein